MTINLTPNPHDLPEFAQLDVIDGLSGQNNVVAPITADKNYGWHPSRRRPERNVMNWLHRLAYRNMDWLKNTFYPEVQNAINSIEFVDQPGYPIIGLDIDITGASVGGYPKTVSCSPGRCALSKIDGTVGIITQKVDTEISCTCTTEFYETATPGVFVPGVDVLQELVSGSKHNLHLFLLGEDPDVAIRTPVLAFSYSETGADLLTNTYIANNFSYFRRLFSFRVTGDSLAPLGAGFHARLPFGSIHKNKLTWCDDIAKTEANDLPVPVTFTSGIGGFSNISNSYIFDAFDIPGKVTIKTDCNFTGANGGLSAKQARIRGYLNRTPWGLSADTDNRNGNSTYYDSDNFKNVFAEIVTVDADTAIFQFDDRSAVVGTTFSKVYINGYEDLRSDFPIVVP